MRTDPKAAHALQDCSIHLLVLKRALNTESSQSAQRHALLGPPDLSTRLLDEALVQWGSITYPETLHMAIIALCRLHILCACLHGCVNHLPQRESNLLSATIPDQPLHIHWAEQLCMLLHHCLQCHLSWRQP